MASRAHHGAGNSDHPGHDLRRYVHAGYRLAASFGGNAHHRLGLLVDVPVVAGDGIKRGLAEGLPRRVAAWLGPTKLARAIFYATLTNIIAIFLFFAQRQHWRVPQKPPYRHDNGIALCIGGLP